MLENLEITKPKKINKIVFLNALPISIFSYFTPILLYVNKVSFNEFKQIISDLKYKYVIDNYIRHNGLIKFLNEQLNLALTPISANYFFDKEDLIFVIVLKTPQRGKEIEQISENDIEIYYITPILQGGSNV